MIWELMDLWVLGYFILIGNNNFESIGILVATIFPVISELWYGDSQLFGLIYILIYVGAVVILFIFILSVLNENEVYKDVYIGLFIILLILNLDELDDNDNNDNDIVNNYITDISNLFNYNSISDLSVLGNLLFTEYSFLLIIISLILLMSIIGLIKIVKK